MRLFAKRPEMDLLHSRGRGHLGGNEGKMMNKKTFRRRKLQMEDETSTAICLLEIKEEHVLGYAWWGRMKENMRA